MMQSYSKLKMVNLSFVCFVFGLGAVSGESFIRSPTYETGTVGGETSFLWLVKFDLHSDIQINFNGRVIYKYQSGREEYPTDQPKKYNVTKGTYHPLNVQGYPTSYLNFTLMVETISCNDTGLYSAKLPLTDTSSTVQFKVLGCDDFSTLTPPATTPSLSSPEISPDTITEVNEPATDVGSGTVILTVVCIIITIIPLKIDKP